MIVCARCGAQNQPTNKFCLSCGAPVQQAGAPAAQPANQGWGAPAPAPAAPQGQWGQPSPQPAPQQWGQPQPAPAPPPAWGQPPAQPPPQQGGWGQPPQAPPAQQAWGQPQPAPAPAQWQQPAPQQQPGVPPAGGFNPAGPQNQRVGSPEGLNPYAATVGPSAQSLAGGAAPAPAPQRGWPGDAYAATAPPPTNDDFEAAHAAQQAQARQSAPPAPAPQQPPPAAARASVAPAGPGVDPEQVDPNAPRALAGFLVSYEGNELGVFFPIHQGQNLVGRKGAAPGLHIELEHGTTSSRHAMLFASARPGRLKVEDLGSTNGTFVGDLMLERGKKRELKDGDVVRFGGYVTIVKLV